MTIERQRTYRQAPIALLLATAVGLALAFTIVLGTTAIQRDWLAGPEFALRLGQYRVLAQTTGRPECLPLPLQQCLITFPIPNTPVSRYYVIWVGQVSQMLSPTPSGVVTISKGRRILMLPILR
jgi:hypothetical protein